MGVGSDSRPVAVVGAGVMGTGIATTVLGSGRHVVLVDDDPSALDRAAHTIPSSYAMPG